jgi:hypothetical protein
VTGSLFSFPDENHKRQIEKLSPTGDREIVDGRFAARSFVDRPASGTDFYPRLESATGQQIRTLMCSG